MTVKTQTYIATAAALCAVTVVVLVVIYWASAKQAIKGVLTNNYFSDSELKHSVTAKRLGLQNEPTKEEWKHLYALRDNILNPAREIYGSYILINDAFRSGEVNEAAGGVSDSQHRTGDAADITTGSVKGNRELFAILVTFTPFDQIIWEEGGRWIHVSYNPARNRRSILSCKGLVYTNIANNWQNQLT